MPILRVLFRGLMLGAALLGAGLAAPGTAPADGGKPDFFIQPSPFASPSTQPFAPPPGMFVPKAPEPPKPVAPPSPPPSPPSPAGTLQGEVRVQPTPSTVPQPQLFAARAGLPVKLIDIGTGRLIGRTYTDALGRYAFPNVPAGTYKVIVGDPVPIQQQIITTPGGIVEQVPLMVIPGGK